MKKVIALALTAAMVTPCIAVRAEDTSRVDRINSIITMAKK